MADFIIQPGDYDRVPEVLTAAVPGLLESEEYRRLDDEERKVPGLVAAAFTRYLERLQDAEPNDDAASASPDALARSYEVIEQMASSSDANVKNLVVTEIFENFRDDSTPRLKRIKQRLGAESRRLYEEWLE